MKLMHDYQEGNTMFVKLTGDNAIPLCKDVEDIKLFYHSYAVGDDIEVDNMLADKRVQYLDYSTKLLIIMEKGVYAKVRVFDGVSTKTCRLDQPQGIRPIQRPVRR